MAPLSPTTAVVTTAGGGGGAALAAQQHRCSPRIPLTSSCSCPMPSRVGWGALAFTGFCPCSDQCLGPGLPAQLQLMRT